MNIYKTELFPYIAGDSLVGKTATMTMASIKTEKLPTHGGKTEEKLVLYFEESDKGLILNKTNAKAIAQAHGGETDEWAGHPLELYTERISAFGKMHNAVRVRIPAASNGKEANGK